MTPKFLTETRSFFETELAFWQAQATTLGSQNVAQAEALVKEVRERAQVAPTRTPTSPSLCGNTTWTPWSAA